MKLDSLTKLNNKKKLWISPKHPFYFEPSEKKIIYGAAILIHAEINKTVNPLNNVELERLIGKGLGLMPSDKAAVIKRAKEGKRIIDDVFQMLNDKVKRYVFLLDIINVCMRDTPLSEEEQQAIDIFSELLYIGEEEKKLLHDFICFSYSMDTDKCIAIFDEMVRRKMDITMTELRYYIPDIEYVTVIDKKKVIKDSNKIQLVDQCKVMDTIYVPKGTVLDIVNANVMMYGNIVMQGGKLRIQDSQIIKKGSSDQPLIHVKSFSVIEIANSVIDCNSKGNAINQENGNLSIADSKIINTTINTGVKFWGNQIVIENTIFENCYSIHNGGAIQIQKGAGIVKNCEFIKCEAKSGGGIYSSDQIMVVACRFHSCFAVQYGSAVFYKGEIKSNLTGCEYYNCLPSKEEVIQYIEGTSDKIISKEYTISVSTILECPLHISELGILNIVDSVVYMNRNIRCKGILNIRNSQIIALDSVGRDLFILDRSRGCHLENSEFDGRQLSGVFRATGSRMHVNNCFFRNTLKGRAIYDAFEPIVTKTIFSYCLGGALYCNAGKIEGCTFINCKGKSGGGILMYGSKGEISDCFFERCVTDYRGAAIDRTRGNVITNCTYVDCQPDNIS